MLKTLSRHLVLLLMFALIVSLGIHLDIAYVRDASAASIAQEAQRIRERDQKRQDLDAIRKYVTDKNEEDRRLVTKEAERISARYGSTPREDNSGLIIIAFIVIVLIIRNRIKATRKRDNSSQKKETIPNKNAVDNNEQSKQAESHLRPCPMCAEPIRAEAKKCRFCGEILTNPVPSASKPGLAQVKAIESAKYMLVFKGEVRLVDERQQQAQKELLRKLAASSGLTDEQLMQAELKIRNLSKGKASAIQTHLRKYGIVVHLIEE